jgi:hypothetical protein
MRVSATLLESFRLWLEPEQEWLTEEMLEDQIRGIFHTNRAIELGSALGKILEDPARHRIAGGYQARGFTFDDATLAPVLELVDRRGIFEAKAQKVYPELGCVVVSKADHLLGAHLSEFKATAKGFDFDKYAHSYQWRFMVDAFAPALVTYRIFSLDDHENGVVEVVGIDNFHLFPYADCHADCVRLLASFVDYVTAKGLDAVLRGQQRAWGTYGVSALIGA